MPRPAINTWPCPPTTRSTSSACRTETLVISPKMSIYQSNRTVRPIVRGWMVPAARPVPVAVYFPVFALLITELFGPVNVNAAFRLVNCTSLNTLYAWSCSLMQPFLRPASVIGTRRDSVMSHSCQADCRRLPTPLFPMQPMFPYGWGTLAEARLNCAWPGHG